MQCGAIHADRGEIEYTSGAGIRNERMYRNRMRGLSGQSRETLRQRREGLFDERSKDLGRGRDLREEPRKSVGVSARRADNGIGGMAAYGGFGLYRRRRVRAHKRKEEGHHNPKRK